MTKLSALTLTACLFIGCKGELGIDDSGGKSSLPNPDPDPEQTIDNGTNGGDDDGTNNIIDVPDPFPEIPCEDVACDDPVPSVTPRVVRLTHDQWENAVRDLLHLEQRSGLSSSFLGDTLSVGHFDRMAENLSITPSLWDDYREASETLAAQVTGDPNALARLLPADAPTDLEGRSRAFVETFGRRAYRRPLTDDEIDRQLALMAEAPEVFGGGGSFERAAELSLRSFLQSPHFLYRVELHTVEGADFVALNSWERASKLSFALWNTMPDTELLDAAERGDLDDPAALRAQVERMLDDPRATDAIEDFHAQLLGYEHFREMSKAEERFPAYTDETPDKLERELQLYVEDVVFDGEGSFRELMTSTHSFADDEISSIYGVDPPATDFGRVELDPVQRKGLLTRAGFLALNATAYDPNPIHRGVFVDERILCMKLPPPPDDFSIPEGVEGNTNRERIDNATGECGGACHVTLINPPGFAFENYDALGQYRTMDNGYPVDASGTLKFDGEDRTWNDASDFVDQLAESPQAHACYVRNWFEYVNGRLPAEGDEPLIARLGQASHSGDVSIKDLLAAIVTSNVFLARDTRSDQ